MEIARLPQPAFSNFVSLLEQQLQAGGGTHQSARFHVIWHQEGGVITNMQGGALASTQADNKSPFVGANPQIEPSWRSLQKLANDQGVDLYNLHVEWVREGAAWNWRASAQTQSERQALLDARQPLDSKLGEEMIKVPNGPWNWIMLEESLGGRRPQALRITWENEDGEVERPELTPALRQLAEELRRFYRQRKLRLDAFKVNVEGDSTDYKVEIEDFGYWQDQP